MRVTFYGVRGSCPAPGPSTVRHGGNTSCVSVELSDGTLIVLDAGTGLRTLGQDLVRRGWSGPIHLLLSHTHWDHVLGLPFFIPLFLAHGRIKLHPLPNRDQERFRRQPTLFDPIHFPVPAADLPAHVELVEHKSDVWEVGGARVRRVALNHPGGAQGFRIEFGARSVCYLTDNELDPPGGVTTTPEALAAFAAGCDVMIHDTQYTHRDMPAKHGWGHSVLDHVLDLAIAARPRQLVLFHHDPDRDDAALDDIGAAARERLAREAPEIVLSVAYEGLVIDLLD
jgi:phosphoribosyl 1,2-cyclic phosphodiesterase